MTEQKEKPVDFNIRLAEDSWRDAEGIARAFNETYEEYPFAAYTDPEKVKNNVIPSEASSNFVIEVLPGQEIQGEEINDPRVVGTGSVKLDEEGRVGELGGAVLTEKYQNMSDVEMYSDLLDTRWNKAYELGADIPFTQPVSSTHAITQYEHAKRDFVPLGVSRNKYPEVFAGEGRETTVPMADANSDFRYVSSKVKGEDEPDVYVNDETFPLVDFVQAKINENREEDKLKRNPRMDMDENVDTGYKLKKKTEDPEVAKNASYQILPGGGKTWQEVKNELQVKQDDDNYQWTGVELDANHPYAWELSEKLVQEGFMPESYFPEKLSYSSDGPRDAIGFQYSEGDTGQIELINEAVEAAESAGLDVNTVPDTGRPHTKFAYL